MILLQNVKKKKFLKAENKQLREQLKKMSENVNLLIDKMNQESLKKKKMTGAQPSGGATDADRPGSQKIRTRQKEIENTDKAIKNMIKEHQRVKKRLEEVQSPDFLLNLKMNIKNAEKEIKEYEKLLQTLHVEQVRREKRMDRILGSKAGDGGGLNGGSGPGSNAQESAQINDSTQRLAFLQEKIGELKE